MKNYADRGGCYPPRPKDLHNSLYPTKAESLIALLFNS